MDVHTAFLYFILTEKMELTVVEYVIVCWDFLGEIWRRGDAAMRRHIGLAAATAGVIHGSKVIVHGMDDDFLFSRRRPRILNGVWYTLMCNYCRDGRRTALGGRS